ncbi:hypothetical protein IWQ62_001387, partial [Dispira parvispora]
PSLWPMAYPPSPPAATPPAPIAAALPPLIPVFATSFGMPLGKSPPELAGALGADGFFWGGGLLPVGARGAPALPGGEDDEGGFWEGTNARESDAAAVLAEVPALLELATAVLAPLAPSSTVLFVILIAPFKKLRVHIILGLGWRRNNDCIPVSVDKDSEWGCAVTS